MLTLTHRTCEQSQNPYNLRHNTGEDSPATGGKKGGEMVIGGVEGKNQVKI